ncbi:hypothetical protein [Streptomyces sp. NPDC005407]|uniref:hypothetical protein n=1 Tax=Streptomyces sp. NPDC005407 TaxID=3155340 RepID=UPI0033ACE6F3
MPTSELAYAQFFDVLTLLRKHWEDFKPALGKQSEKMGLLSRFEALRNSVAHSRDLLPFEEELLSGIAGEIRNRVTIYMSSQDPTGDYFARIDSVTDSLGNCIDSFPQDPMEHGASLRTGAVLHPGDVITFRCRGTDPQGRDLVWWFLPNWEADNRRYTGRDLEIAWPVRSLEIAARVDIHIYMESTGPHHRVNTGTASFDHCATFIYTVLPRDEPDGPVRMANVRWLAGYRHPRHATAAGLAERLMLVFSVPSPLMGQASLLGDPIAVLPAVFHLLWAGRLRADLSKPLTDTTLVSRAEAW